MKNEEVSLGITPILFMVLFALVLVFVVWVVIEDVLEQEFKITKKECWNETVYLTLENIKNNTISLTFWGTNDKKGFYNITLTNECFNLSNKNCSGHYKECKQIEVEELEILREDLGVVLLATTDKDSPVVQLNLEFLDENCECFAFYCKNKEDYNCEIQNRKFCYYYKCGEDYQIEVLK